MSFYNTLGWWGDIFQCKKKCVVAQKRLKNTALHLSREHWRQPHVSPVVGAVDSVNQFVRSSHVAAHVIQDVDAVWKGCDVW